LKLLVLAGVLLNRLVRQQKGKGTGEKIEKIKRCGVMVADQRPGGRGGQSRQEI
jgi:hypothetical protein